MKECTECRTIKPFEAFGGYKRSPDGYQYRCTACNNYRRRGERKRNMARHDGAFYADQEANPGAVRSCTDCGATKHISKFNRLRPNACGFSFYCKVCSGVRVWSAQNEVIFTGRQYVELLEKQRGVCAICGGAEGGTRYRRLSIDHCHRAGRIRGLLCNKCNRAIGMLGDSPETLRRAADYIECEAMWLSEEPYRQAAIA